jgi:hypothetical protein
MKTEPLFGANGMDDLVALLRAAGMTSAPSGSWNYPMADEWTKATLRCNELDPGSWFKRIVREASGRTDAKDDLVKSVIESCEIAEGVALFVSLKWKAGKITYLSAQVFVTLSADLIEFFNGADSDSRYYRLDFSSEERGNLFDHPFPHLHTIPEGSPRLPWHFRPNITPIFSFLEFVFINHQYERWKRWLIQEHKKKFSYPSTDDQPLMEDVFESFKEPNSWSRVTDGNRLIQELKAAAIEKLETLSEAALPIDPTLLPFNYWSELT